MCFLSPWCGYLSHTSPLFPLLYFTPSNPSSARSPSLGEKKKSRKENGARDEKKKRMGRMNGRKVDESIGVANHTTPISITSPFFMVSLTTPSSFSHFSIIPLLMTCKSAIRKISPSSTTVWGEPNITIPDFLRIDVTL